MTWSIKLEAKNGAAFGLKVTGTPPDGPVIVTGYENSSGRAIGVQAGEFTASAYAPAQLVDGGSGRTVDAGQLARAAYRAYGERTGHRNHCGDPMPGWDELGDTITDAWTHAAAAVMRQVLKGE